jgi:homoserine dehydrogenase
MTEHDIMILKFGGSVLRDNNCFDVVVDECHRAVHSGHRVVAVISAYQGMTDMLQKEIDAHHAPLDASAVTSLLSLGEVLAAGAAGLALLGAGLQTHVANVSELRLQAEGDPLDAHPISVDVDSIRSVLVNKQVLVIPGFMAVDSRGRIVLLGRGGSDLTAIHLASELDPVSTTIIRDVDGMYTHDPALFRGGLRRYERINYQDVTRLENAVMQPKALACAELHGLVFTVRASDSTGGTIVGPGSTIVEAEHSHQESNLKS